MRANLDVRSETSTMPLAMWAKDSISDPDEAVSLVAGAFVEHRLDFPRKTRRLDARFAKIPLNNCGLVTHGYGREAEIRGAVLKDFYSLSTVAQGRIYARSGTDGEATMGDGEIMIASPTGTFDFSFSGDAQALAIRIERDFLEDYAYKLTGIPITTPLVFDMKIPVRDGAGATLNTLLHMTADLVNRDPEILKNTLLLDRLEEMILIGLLTACPHNYSIRFEAGGPGIAPRHVRKVEEYIYAHSAEPVTLIDLAELTGVSVRSIHNAFRSFRGYSPIAFLKSVRMARVRERLLAAEPEDTVTSIALECGFGHLGRFSADYRRRYGEAPCETLKRR